MTQEQDHIQQVAIEELQSQVAVDEELELFADELEDHFNAKVGSTASTVACATGCLSSASSACCLF